MHFRLGQLLSKGSLTWMALNGTPQHQVYKAAVFPTDSDFGDA